MIIAELVTQAKMASPEKLSIIPDGKAALLIREVFSIILKQIHDTDESTVPVSGLGHFRTRQIEHKKNGETLTVKRFALRPAELPVDK